jgi:hypothetical protein
LDRLKRFVTQCNYNPFWEYGASQDLVSDYVIRQLSDIVSRGGFVFLAREQDEILGLIASEKLEWDSAHFGFEISKIAYLFATGDYFESLNIKQQLISHLLTRCYKTLSLHLSARVNKEDLSSIHALESKCFRLMDVLVTYSIDFRKRQSSAHENQYPIRELRSDEIPTLRKMALDCFEGAALATDRFHADPTLPKEKSSEVYAKWLSSASNDPFCKVFVAEIDGKPVGFIVCRINQFLADVLGIRVGSLDLIAVASSARNRKVACSLLNASLSWLAGKVDFVEGGGQVSNFAIQRAFNAVGLKITKCQCTFHWSVMPDSLK